MKKHITSLFFSTFLILTNSFAQETVEDSALPLRELREFSEVFDRIKQEYVDEVDDATLLDNAVRGMLNGLDPHSFFLEEITAREIKNSSKGYFGGLGVEITAENGVIKVITAIDHTPAFYAGIKSGDLIMSINGTPVSGLGVKKTVEMMHGKPGSEIDLTIIREGESEPIEMTLVRAIIKLKSVKGKLLQPGYGYIRLSEFQNSSAPSISNMVERLNKNNKSALKGLILDLRNNPGGTLTAAVNVADLFLQNGEIVSTRGRTAGSRTIYKAKADDILTGAPLIILVNGGSASASEIVAGALQDHARAIVVGNKTFGKGSVQTQFPLKSGRELRITTARYYTPAGRSIQSTGIVPDIIMQKIFLNELPPPGDQLKEADLYQRLTNENLEDEGDNQQSQKLAPQMLTFDNQINEALNVLKGMSLVLESTKERE